MEGAQPRVRTLLSLRDEDGKIVKPVTEDLSGRSETIPWGKVSKTRMNEWVTADALYVLRAAGRLK